MCQAVVYLAQTGQETQNMGGVILRQPVKEGEEPVILQARIGRMDLKHSVRFMPAEGGQDDDD
jgi:hypothetical protein